MRNAPWTAQRRLGVLKYAEGNPNVRKVCKRFGISRTTFYSWQERYQKEGLRGLETRSSAPRKPYRKVTPSVEKAIVALAKKGFLNLYVLCYALKEEQDIKIGVTTVSHILKKHNLDIKALEKDDRRGY